MSDFCPTHGPNSGFCPECTGMLLRKRWLDEREVQLRQREQSAAPRREPGPWMWSGSTPGNPGDWTWAWCGYPRGVYRRARGATMPAWYIQRSPGGPLVLPSDSPTGCDECTAQDAQRAEGAE
jgi:hypothetical protein